MKALFISLTLSLTACASTTSTTTRGGHINVHAVRVEIARMIDALPGKPGARTIVSMGKVTAEMAVVYTDTAAGRREETWARTSTGWKLSATRDVASR